MGDDEELIAMTTSPTSGHESPRAPQASADVLARLRGDVARLLDREADAVGDEEDLTDLGLDSIRLMSLLQGWSGPGVELDFVDFVQDPRLGRWAELVTAATTGAATD
ncbi:phosphopantetheine-binding protein [Actinomycetospora endophytica]|uniref:Phosphopantetheine-binding protein n=1 Tax=Actinomycetospora endophytica TaxID=2291215 RepID=A0ABS8PI41_9PSEU|nr:phosphopantetheine-binding protein [Actinomycetospora endophytica]MCD2197602.1 phosphopantetheine-binding protein [Actinomycetospora endophytica]